MKDNQSKKIAFVLYTMPGGYTILGTAAHHFADRHWKVRFYGISARDNLRTNAPHGNISERVLGYCPPGIRQKLHFLFFQFWSAFLAWRWGADVIHCSERNTAIAGWFATVFFRIPVVYHEHDPPSASRGVIDRFLGWMRVKLARRAIVCVIPNQERYDDFREATVPKCALMIWNAVSRSEVAEQLDTNNLQLPLRLWYQGALGEGQFPLEIVDALKQVDGVELRYVGYNTGTQKYDAKIQERAKELGIQDRVRYLGSPQTREELLNLSHGSHVGLALFSIPFRDPMAGASQKPFEYLARGMAVLVPDTKEWRHFIINNGLGRGCNPGDPASIAAVLTSLRDNIVETVEMGARGHQKVLQSWNYENLLIPLVNCIEEST